MAISEVTAASLLSNNTDPNPAHNADAPPLVIAAERGSLELVEMLIRLGAKTGATGSDGQTSLQVDERLGHREVAALIQEHEMIPRTYGSYMPTPIIVEGRLYTCNDNGRLAVRDCKTGEEIYRQRIGTDPGTHSASAVSAGGNLYFSNESGKIIVVRAGDEYELVAENEMGQAVLATPAIAGNRIFIRGVKELFCIGKPDQEGSSADKSDM